MMDKERAVQRVIDAWNDPGSHPGYHYRTLAELRVMWPTLTRAIEDLIKSREK